MAARDKWTIALKYPNPNCGATGAAEASEDDLAKAKTTSADAGDVWTWVALDVDTKLICSFYVGDRGYGAAREFIDDLAERLANRVQLTSDGHKAYLTAVAGAFGHRGID